MLQARSEQPGDTPSPEASATLQQPQNNLQPTGTNGANSTSTPQTTPAVTQQQLQALNLRVGDTQTLIANSTVAQPGTAPTNTASVWLWAAIPILVLVAVVWRIRSMSAAIATVAVAESADVPAAPVPHEIERAAVPARSGSFQKPQPTSKKPKKSAKGSRRNRKQKRS